MAVCKCTGEKVDSPQDVQLMELLDHYRDYEGGLIPVLQEAQNIYGYLPADALERISQELSIPFSEVFGVVTFYSQFHLKPRGRNIIRVCLGTACHVLGGSKILEPSKTPWVSAMGKPRKTCASPWNPWPVSGLAAWRHVS